MKKLIAVELNIPDEYKEREDFYMEQLLDQLRQDSTLITIDYIGKRDIKKQQTAVKYIFTGNYEFVDPIKGF